MKTKYVLYPMVVLSLVASLAPIPAAAQRPEDEPDSLSGSYVAFDPSVGGRTCYVPWVTQEFCFIAESWTNDYEYRFGVWQKFPADWEVIDAYFVGTPVCDSGAGWGSFGWGHETWPNEVFVNHPVAQATTDHCVAYYCYYVFTSTGAADAVESWYWDGDGYGNAPHHPCSSDAYTPASMSSEPCDEWVNAQASIPQCTEPIIVVEPTSLHAGQCPDELNELELGVLNYGGAPLIWSLSEQPAPPGGGAEGADSVAFGGEAYDAPWLSEAPTSGTLSAGTCQDVTVTFDSTGMAPGDYFANLRINSNDPDTPSVTVPVQMTVPAPPSNAGFDWSPLTPLVGETVTFHGWAQGSDPLTYDWDFGDGGGGGGAVVTHAYAAAGSYLVTLTVSNQCGQEVVTHQVVVTEGCEPVAGAEFTWDPVQPYVGQEVTFTGSVAEGSEPIHYAWAFNTAEGTEGDNPIVHVFGAPGDYLVSMWAWNGCGQELVQHTVTVLEPPPILHVGFVHLRYVDRGAGKYALRARVQVLDTLGREVPSAMVYVEWTSPNSVVTPQNRLTDFLGEVPFKAQTRVVGEWHFCVIDAVKSGWTYDPAANVETCDTVSVP